jgi:hypothetical protein
VYIIKIPQGGIKGEAQGFVEKSGGVGTFRRIGIRRSLTLASDTERIAYGKREKSG